MKIIITAILACLFVSSCSFSYQPDQNKKDENQDAESSLTNFVTSQTSKIAFNSDRDGNVEIYSMNPDGSELTRLTDSPFFDGAPDWSPDGRYIVFLTDRDGNAEIYRMDANGNHPINLTNDPFDDTYPDWSPDMTHIVFESIRDGNLEIYVMNADGTDQTRLTDNPGDDYGARWSPDGKKIAFSSLRNGNLDVYLMNPDGSAQINITNHPANDCNPTWSWEGGKLAFDSDRDENYEIYSMDRDGSNTTRLTYSTGNYGYPDWSPDGRRIVFSVANGEDWDIYAMDYDGGNITELLTGTTGEFNPRWSPGTTTLPDQMVINSTQVLASTQESPPAVLKTPFIIEDTGWVELAYSGTVDLSQPTPKMLEPYVIFHGQNSLGAGFGCEGCYIIEPALDVELVIPQEDINGADFNFRGGEEYQYFIKGFFTDKKAGDIFAGSLRIFDVTYLERLK